MLDSIFKQNAMAYPTQLMFVPTEVAVILLDTEVQTPNGQQDSVHPKLAQSI
jgi:hypothetical protein